MLRKRTFTGQLNTDFTQREKINGLLARKAATQGFVLLKNDNQVLPVSTDNKIALYGSGAVKTIKGGTGSGDVNQRYNVSIYEGLMNAGYEITSKEWLSSYEKIYDETRINWRDKILEEVAKSNNPFGFFGAYSSNPFMIPAGDEINKAEAKNDGADVAIYVVSRIAGEGKDRHDEKGDYYLTDEEKNIVDQICECYKDVVLVLNVGGIVDLAFTKEYKNISAILMMSQAGQEGGNAFADVISGKVTPSGKLTDTWPVHYEDYPSANTFGYKNDDIFKEYYLDGIYVGYRFFDTFEVPVLYSFGYGLSYTDFDISFKGVEVKAGKNATVSAIVKNTGNTYSGKEVVQVYVSCPQGELTKEYRRLSGFGKTKELSPGQSQELDITFDLYHLASYKEETASYILEKGTYGIWVGNSLDNAKLVAGFELDNTVTVKQLKNICPIKAELKEIAPETKKLADRLQNELSKVNNLEKIELKAADFSLEAVDYTNELKLSGKAGEIVAGLTQEELIRLSTGDPSKGQGSMVGDAGQTVPGAAAETTSFCVEKGIASIVLADGPAGIRINREYDVKDGKLVKVPFEESFEGGFFSKGEYKVDNTTKYYQYCTAIPVGTLLAQSFDVELVKEVGEMIGNEMNLFEVTLWLAPGMNIHRNPLCGRNFEYYSEDPLVSGIIAGAMTLGVQSVPGCGTTIKHFATNNLEDNRMGNDSIIHERALREIYLKGFEIAIRNSKPMSIMTSYNMINGVHTANCYDICTDAARKEWGFTGAIMTDWTTTTNSTAGECSAAGCMKAGNELVMPGDEKDHESIKKALEDGSLTIDEMRRNIYNVVNMILQSNQYENVKSFSAQYSDLEGYMKAVAK